MFYKMQAYFLGQNVIALTTEYDSNDKFSTCSLFSFPKNENIFQKIKIKIKIIYQTVFKLT